MVKSYTYLDLDTSRYHLDISSKSELLKFVASSCLVVMVYYISLYLIIDSNAFLSFLSYSILGIIPVLLYTRLLIGSNLAIKLVLFAYVIKSIIGIVFYLILIDPNYFGDGRQVAMTAVEDFSSMYSTILNYVDKFDFTYQSIVDNDYGSSHPELYALMSVPFRFTGGYYLSIAPFNVICSSMMAVIISYITKLREGNFYLALLLALFNPLSLTSTYFFRDLFGQLLASFALVLVVLSNTSRIITIFIASYLFYLQRTPYVVIPIASYVLYMALQNKSGKMRFYTIIAVLASVVLLITFSAFLGNILEKGNYTEAQTKVVTYVLFPVRYIITIIGPFPWTQIFDPVPEKKFFWQDFIFSSALFLITFKYFPIIWKKIKNKETIDYLTVVALMLMLMGVMTTPPHLGYVGWSLCFFLPTFVNYINIRQIAYFTIRFFLIMIVFNIIYTSLGMGGVLKLIS